MNNRFYENGVTLEEAFFRKRDAELIAQRGKLEKMKRTRAALEEVSGISNAAVLDKLIEMDISPEIFSSIAVVPLVEVAWADGMVDEKEHAAVLAAVDGIGIHKGSIDYDLLEAWLKHRPPAKLLEAWVHYISGICETLTKTECESLKTDLLGRARKVAEVVGGILGLAMRTSPEERAVLKIMEKAFSTHLSSKA